MMNCKGLRNICAIILLSTLDLNLAFAATAPKSKQQQAKQATAKQKQFNTIRKAQQKDSTASQGTRLERGEKLYKSCAVCHGSDGLRTAPGQIDGRNILGYTQRTLARELVAYRRGKADNGGLAVIMVANMKGFSDSEIDDLSTYITKLSDEARAKGKISAPREPRTAKKTSTSKAGAKKTTTRTTTTRTTTRTTTQQRVQRR